MTTQDIILNSFGGVKCNSVLFPSPYSIPITVTEKTTFEEAFKVLLDNQILAVPIIDSQESTVITVLSMVDILCIILHYFSEEELKKLRDADVNIFEVLYDKFLEKRSAIINQKLDALLVKHILEFHLADSAYPVTTDTTVLDAMKLMTQKRVHRVFVIDAVTGQFQNFITQTRIMDLLGTLLHSVPEADKKLKDLPLEAICTKEVVCISEDEMALKAFRMMKQYGITGLGVVNESNQLVGAISATDLKLMESDLTFIPLLASSIRDYLKTINNPEILKERHPIRFALTQMPVPVITCEVEDTLGLVIRKMNFYQIHRIFLVNGNQKPIGVISMQNILTFFLKTRGILQ